MTLDTEMPDPNDIKEVYIIPTDFFMTDGFIERLKKELAIFRQHFRTEEKERIKNPFNAFQFVCLNAELPENIKLEAQLLFLDTLSFYAQQYESKETCVNIINSFENGELKDKLFSKFPAKAKMIYAETLFKYYNLVKHEEPIFSFGKTELLIKAKSYLWRVYIHHLDKKNVLNKLDLSHCLTLLSISLGELSRWFEPLYHLNEAKSHLFKNPNIEYTRAIILDSLKQKTCINYNSQLLLKIIDSCMEVKSLLRNDAKQKQQLDGIERECRTFLAKHNLKISKLRQHKRKVSKSITKYNAFRKYCSTNQLFLNEHSFFCNCGLSTKDDLQIQTSHDHTKIEWVNQFERLVNLYAHDFIVARHNYYYSLNETSISFYKVRDFGRQNSTESIKNTLLKNSFKTLYSLLDQIAHGIFQVMEVDHGAKLKELFPIESERPKMYFLNMWDYKLFDDSHFLSNFYLISLYSIAKDLDHSKYAALKEFREMRNAMEHKILHIVQGTDTTSIYHSDDSIYTKDKLTEKTKILMTLTKSAIFSFIYLVRRQSKIKMKAG